MKNLKCNILVLATILMNVVVFAQSPPLQPGVDMYDTTTTIDDVFAHLSLVATDTFEGGAASKYMTLRHFWGARAVKNDGTANSSTGVNMFTQYFNTLHDAIVTRQSQPSCGEGFHGNWEVIGPLELPLQNIGKVDAIWIDPADEDIILAGGIGGLFKSTDGGDNWLCITDNTVLANGIFGVTSICVDPTDKDNIYLGTSGLEYAGQFAENSQGIHWLIGGAAIVKSSDGGSTWTQETFGGGTYWDEIARVQEVYITPDGARLYALSGHKIYTRSTSSTTWQDITPVNNIPSGFVNNSGNELFDLAFVPGSSNHFFVSGRYERTSGVPSTLIWESTVAVPGQSDWQEIAASGNAISHTISSTTVNAADIFSARFDIPDANTLYVMTMHYSSPYTKSAVLTYDFNATTPSWTLLGALPLFSAAANEYKMDIQVAETYNTNHNARLIYIGTTVPYVSWDNCQNWTQIGEYTPTVAAPTHADVRAMFLHTSTNSTRGEDDVLFIATDGGVSKKSAGSDPNTLGKSTTDNINGYGLALGTIWGVDASEHGGLLLAGAMHNQRLAYEPTKIPKWVALQDEGGDGYTAIFDRNDRTVGYSLMNGGLPPYSGTVTVSGGGREMNSEQYSTVPGQGGGNFEVPLAADDDNKHYYGAIELFHNTISNPYSVGSWTTTATGLPGNTGRGVRKIALSPYEDLRGYVLYDHQIGGNIQELYYRDPAVNGGVFDRKIDTIFAEGDQRYPITDVTLDPHTPERVWISQGGINVNETNNQAHNRVKYSPNAGGTWYATDNGLPIHMPVTDIVYQEGANIVYCATDVGIYKADFNNFNSSNPPNYDIEWECFSDRKSSGVYFPNVYVTQLKPNYCTGKLFASTHGRSIWASDMFENDFRPTPKEVISSNTTWSSTRYIRTGIRVTNGATLTISSSSTTIYMPKNGEIVIEPGSKLIVDGATITNGCEDCMWNGVRVIGDPTEPQTSAKQGTVVLTDATIEHAKIALANHSSEGIPSATTGGIIEATNAHFLNNARSVSIETYTYKTAWSVLLKNYQASFVECTFEINDDFKGGTINPYSSHVVMQEVNGPAFRGCEFYNRNTSDVYKGVGEGIRALFSGFTVKAYCNPSTSPCTTIRNKFTGFSNGIYIGKIRTDLYAYIIDRSDFDSCGVGIKLDGPSVGVSSRNHFNIGTGKVVNLEITTDCHKNIGIWGESSYKPTIEDNEFEGVTFIGQHADHENVGVLMDNSGEEVLLIYKNDFHDLDFAAVARGKNSENYWQPTKGIKYECNIFEDNDYDIVIRELGTATGNNIQNVAYSQGSALRSAGNIFVNTTSDNHFVNSVSFWPYNVYYHSSGTTEPNVHPTYSGLSPIFTGNAHTCNTRYPTGTTTGNRDLPLSSGDLGTAKASFTANNNDLKDKLNDYISLLDGGDTDGLVDDINNATDADTPTLKTTLLNNSPYLTKTALYTLADVDILSHTGLIEILEENPEVLRDLDFLYKLENEISNPLSSTQIDDLKTVAETPSERSDKEAEIAYYQTMVADLGNLVVSHYLLDTSGSDIDSIPVWLDSIGTLQAAYLKVAHYTGIGDYTAASSILSNISTNFSLTTEQSNQHNLFSSLWAIIDDVYADNRTLSELTTQEISDIEDIYDDPEADGKQIQVEIDIIWNQDEPVMKQPCDFDTLPTEAGKHGQGNSSHSNEKIIGELSSVSRNHTIKVYPNPARDYVIFDFKLRRNVSDATLNVTSPSGRLVYNKIVKSKSKSVEWDTHSVPSGIYIYELKDGNQTLDIGKIVIAK